MRVVSYNILCGGLPVAGGGDRLEDILGVIRTLNADIIALQECVGFDRDERWTKICRALDLPFSARARGALYDDGHRYGVALFSRYRLRDIHVFAEQHFQAAALAAVAETPLGDIALCNVHLHATREQARLAELDLVMARQSRAGPQIMLGDFNAISRVDSYPAHTAEFEHLTLVTDRMDAVLVDVMAAAPAYSHFSPLAADHQRSVMRRIDYIYASQDLAGRLLGAQVHRSPRADRASDHYPVVAEFDHGALAFGQNAT